MAVHLVDSGHFGWPEWAQTLGDEIANARDNGIAEDGSAYYTLWLRALERLAGEKALVAADDLDALAQQWAEAYATTPHGDPVTLQD